MTGKILLASLASAIILFVWGFIFWGLLGGLGTIDTLPNEPEVSAVLQDQVGESGTYFAPSYGFEGGEEEKKAWEERHKAGPIYVLHYRQEGAQPMGGGTFAMGFVHFFVVSLIMCLLLRWLGGSLESYGKRLMLVVSVAVFASILIDFSPPIWFYTPWGPAFAGLFSNVVGWLFAGAAIASILKPEKA